MSAPPDLDPPGPSADALIRYRDQYELAIRDEDGRWDAAFGLWRGIGVGACLGILLVPLALVLDISSIDVLSVVSALSLAGGGYGALRTRLALRGPGLTTSTENNEQRAALEEHRQRFAAIDMEVETLRRAGVEPREISQRAKQQADDAYSALRRRLERQSALLSPPVPLPPAPQSMTGSLPVTSPSADPAPITPARSSGGVTPRTDVLPIPEELIAAKRAGKLVPFIGAGLSLGLDVRGRFPNWAQLPGRMLDEIKAHRWDDADDRATLRGRFLIADPADPGREIARAKPLQDMLLELDTVKHKLGHDYANALSTIFLPHWLFRVRGGQGLRAKTLFAKRERCATRNSMHRSSASLLLGV